jgi:hypothetical protein
MEADALPCFPPWPESCSGLAAQKGKTMLWTVMKKFVMAALLAAFAGAPSVAWAGTTGGRSAPVSDTNGRRQVASAPVEAFSGEAAGYAAREAATPALAQFAGGGGGIYIGSGAVVVILLVIIIVLLL